MTRVAGQMRRLKPSAMMLITAERMVVEGIE